MPKIFEKVLACTSVLWYNFCVMTKKHASRFSVGVIEYKSDRANVQLSASAIRLSAEMIGNGANRILNADTAEKACGRRA